MKSNHLQLPRFERGSVIVAFDAAFPFPGTADAVLRPVVVAVSQNCPSLLFFLQSTQRGHKVSLI